MYSPGILCAELTGTELNFLLTQAVTFFLLAHRLHPGNCQQLQGKTNALSHPELGADVCEHTLPSPVAYRQHGFPLLPW